MYHSITFAYVQGSLQDTDPWTYVNTWDDWGLIPTSRPTIAQPTAVYKYVDIPGRDGSLDTTDYLIGRPTLTDRKGSLEFIVPNDGVAWTDRRYTLANIFDGRKMRMILEDEPDYYYYGRFFFKEWRSEANFSKLTIEYQVDPYRYSVQTDREAGL